MADDLGGGRQRILIVEDHPIMRQGIRLLVNQESDLMICGEVATAVEAMEAAQRLRPNVVLIALKESSGLELIKDLRQAHPLVPILVLSMRDESFFAERVLRAGARGFVAKGDGTLIEGIRKILAGDVYVSEAIASRVIQGFVGGGEVGVPLVHNLTDRELEVFELVGQGLTTRQVAQRLALSIKTIGSHREHIKDKLKLTNATDLLRHAMEWVRMPLESAESRSVDRRTNGMPRARIKSRPTLAATPSTGPRTDRPSRA